MSGKPFPKSKQLARGAKRYHRKVASPKQWQALSDAKMGPCRVCGHRRGIMHLHHLVDRVHGGDDVADNLVPLCWLCHDAITAGVAHAHAVLDGNLTGPERAYVARRSRSEARRNRA